MGLFDRQSRKTSSVEIQAAEGAKRNIDISSLMEGRLAAADIPGTFNDYETYASQVKDTYRKYNGREQYGNQQTRAIVDIRSAFIAGEGISVSCQDDRTADWIDDFLVRSRLQGSVFLNAVKATEMAGYALMKLDVSPESGELVIRRYKYREHETVKPVYSDADYSDELLGIQVKREGVWYPLDLENVVYVRTGGDDSHPAEPTTKVGVVLTDIDNYDRALKEIRRNNYIFARVTPTFKVNNEAEAVALKRWLQSIRWKIGTAFIGSAEFEYKSPSTAAYENLAKELTTTLKTISGATGVPVHWLGHTDLMSNRATAYSLYESIKNATIYERSIWEEALYDIILKAQEMHINMGGDLTLNREFEVKLPLIDFDGFGELVDGLSKAYNDRAISLADYRNELPGIDPLKTAKAVEAEDASGQMPQRDVERNRVREDVRGEN